MALRPALPAPFTGHMFERFVARCFQRQDTTRILFLQLQNLILRSPRFDAGQRACQSQATLSGMRRWLTLLLLALLPLQLSWAAVASYCGHETKTETSHMGHHAHKHDGNMSIDADFVSTSSGTVDAAVGGSPYDAVGVNDTDCGHCHGYCSAILTAPPELHGGLFASLIDILLDASWPAVVLSQPERPQWTGLA